MPERHLPNGTGPQVNEDSDELQSLKKAELREARDSIVDLLSRPARVFLLGAGCSKCAGLPLMGELTQKVLSGLSDTPDAKKVLEGLKTHFAGGDGCTIEDYMSELVDHISIAERREFRSSESHYVEIQGERYLASTMREALEAIKLGIKEAIANAKIDLQHHRRFVESLHKRLQSGKAANEQFVDYFTLNYDTLVEDALSLECVPSTDGFLGGTTAWWNPDTYEDPKNEARVFKIHGSVDWSLWRGETRPRRVRPDLGFDGDGESVMIWPAATKYKEAQRDPHAQILDRFRQSLRPEPQNERVLVVMGYSFGDSHINYELDRALRESDGRLTAMVFSTEEKPSGVVKSWVEDANLNDQVRVYARGGFFHADERITSSDDLYWWKFEVLVRLLGGEQ